MPIKTYKVWESLKGTNSNKEKLNILLSHQDNSFLKDWLHYTYNPYLTFGISYAPQSAWDTVGTELNGIDIHVRFFTLLDSLHNREFTGNSAKEQIEQFFKSVSLEVARMFNAVLNKDIACGVSLNTINKVYPRLIPTFNIAKANPFDNSIPYPCVAEVKMNGVRLIAKLHHGNITMFSSNGRVADGLTPIELQIHNIAKHHFGQDYDKVSLVLDGELTDINRRSVSGIFNKALKGTIKEQDTQNLLFTVFDILTGKEWEQQYSETPQHQRYLELKTLLDSLPQGNIALIESRTVHSQDDISVFNQEVVQKGGEGLIVKDPEAPYSFTRNNSFQKIKAELEADLRIIGFTQGTGKRLDFIGAIIAETSDSKIQVRVGSGLTDQDLVYFTNNKEQLIGSIITVLYNAVIQDKDNQLSLFLPRFVELRSDKTEADTTEKVLTESGTSEL